MTRLRQTGRLRLASYPTSSSDYIFYQQNNSCDLAMLSQGGGTSATWTVNVKDTIGAAMLSANPVNTGVAVPPAGPGAAPFTVEWDADMLTRTALLKVNGTTVWSGAFAGTPSTNFFNTAANRKLLYLSSSSIGSAGTLDAATEIEYLRTYKTVADAETLHAEVVGPASAANAHPWKLGAAAT